MGNVEDTFDALWLASRRVELALAPRRIRPDRADTERSDLLVASCFQEILALEGFD